ncbi:MAG: hypothetical protein IJS28_07560 [Synergistaceae bacterium]|nr:hypothetical protein [Synergistaceae bacterium]
MASKYGDGRSGRSIAVNPESGDVRVRGARQDNFMGVYDDEEDYNPYRDFGQERDNDPNWGYDNFDTYDDGLTEEEYGRYMGSRANKYADYMSRPLEDYERPEREIGVNSNNHSPQWENGYTTSSSDEDEYLDYLEQYDKGEISNHEMSRIQRRYAEKPFWDTFNPSEELIEQYGSGNESTRWPMFERRGGRWRPVFWRND